MGKKQPFPEFKLPKALLNQIGECTRGYFFVAINENGEFEIYTQFDDVVSELAMVSFLIPRINKMQELLNNCGEEEIANIYI